jgi:hypothetical protein
MQIANLLGPGGVYTGINVYSLQLSYKATYLSVQKLAAIGRALPGSGIGGVSGSYRDTSIPNNDQVLMINPNRGL